MSGESLGAFLVESGALSRRALDEALYTANEQQEPLEDRLVVGGYLTRDEIRRAHAHLLGVPFIEIPHESIQEEALYLIPEPLSRGRSMVAFRRTEHEVEVALLDLDDLEHLDFLYTDHKLKVLPRLTSSESLKRALIHYQKKLKVQFSALAKGGAHAAEALLRHALLSRASSVHLDFKTVGLLVRYRIHGLLEDAMTLPKEALELVARLKDMAQLSPTLHVPQEGAFKVDIGHGDTVRVRAHTMPAQMGERMVLHLHPSSETRKGFTLESLGLHGEALESVHKLLTAKSGLVLVAGADGSGKSTLLYTLLDALHTHGRHLVTVEEEVEYTLPHATQIRTRPEVGLGTAATLRAALKQDPDIIMVSHVRDHDTAQLVVSAASRGILVLTGTETEGSEEAVARLAQFGAPRTTIDRWLQGVVVTTVVGKVCPECKETYKLSRAESTPFEGRANFGTVLAALKEEGSVHPDMQWKELNFARAGGGCSSCQGGYIGSVGLQEVVVRGETPFNLIEDGLFKAAQGITSIEEVFRLLERGE